MYNNYIYNGNNFYDPRFREFYHRDCYDYSGDMISSSANKRSFTTEEAAIIARRLNIDFNRAQFDLEQFRMGLDVELEHGLICPHTNVTSNDPIMTGKIALVHLFELPDYYTRLAKMENEGEEYWKNVDIYKNC